MRGVRKAIAMAMRRPSCGRRSSSEEVVAMLSWAGDLGGGISGPACQGHPHDGARYPEGCVWHVEAWRTM
eukprot:3814921-Pyramimonas_sp.AAC.1